MIQGIVQSLLDSPTVTSLLGQKVFPVVAPQAVKKPYVTARIVANAPNQNKDAASTLDAVTFQVFSYSEKYSEVDAIDNAVRSVIDNASGEVEGIQFDRIYFETHQDLFDQEDQAFMRESRYTALIRRS